MTADWMLVTLHRLGRPVRIDDPASLRDLIATADYVNHAVPTHEEVTEGLASLIAGGLARATKDGIRNRKHANEALEAHPDKWAAAKRLVERSDMSATPLFVEQAAWDDAIRRYSGGE